MTRMVVRCPSCEEALVATKLSCRACGTSLDGQFEIPALLQLSPQDLSFVSAFVRSSGSLKAMAQQLGISYPTVRNRLDEIVRQLEALEAGTAKKKHEILDALEAGKLTAKDAAEQLKKVGL